MEKPILFNTEMVKAILNGKKISTRRPIKRTPSNDEPSGYGFWKEFNKSDNRWYIKDYTHACVWWTLEEYISKFGKYHIGDTLWIRETWQEWTGGYAYKVGGDYPQSFIDKWKPSIHMPRTAARIFLKITDIRIERLQDISEDGAIKEGFEEVLEVFTAKELFQATWNSIYKNWDENPYVWVIEFERVEG